MPVSSQPVLSLHGITYRTPDARTLFDHVDLSFGRDRCAIVGRNGAGKSTLLRLMTGELAPASGRIAVSGSVRLLSQMSGPEQDRRVADLFGVADELERLHWALDGRANADDLAEIDWTLEERMADALSRFGLAGLPVRHDLARLSGGERMRAGFAALVFGAPDLILLDEPTNNLDHEGRALVHRLLDEAPGGTVTVSHDRALLESMDRIVEISELGVRAFGGGWSAFAEARDAARARAEEALDSARHSMRATEEKLQTLETKKARSERQGRAERRKGSQPKMALDDQKQRSENSTSGAARLSERKRAEAADQVRQAEAQVERATTAKVILAASTVASRKLLLSFEAVGFAHPGGPPCLQGISFAINGPERIAVAGRNGSGKSTLLHLAIGVLQPDAGRIRRPGRAVMLDQEVALLRKEWSILENFLALNPDATGNLARAQLARFLFRNDAALVPVGQLSGGERLRAGLACVTSGARPPELLVLDEPTNNLDIESIEAMEAGLNGFAGGLLVVSHDTAFLNAIGINRRIELGL